MVLNIPVSAEKKHLKERQRQTVISLSKIVLSFSEVQTNVDIQSALSKIVMSFSEAL